MRSVRWASVPSSAIGGCEDQQPGSEGGADEQRDGERERAAHNRMIGATGALLMVGLLGVPRKPAVDTSAMSHGLD